MCLSMALGMSVVDRMKKSKREICGSKSPGEQVDKNILMECRNGEEIGKILKHGKVEMKSKGWVLAKPPYSLQGNGRQSFRVETTGIDPVRGG